MFRVTMFLRLSGFERATDRRFQSRDVASFGGCGSGRHTRPLSQPLILLSVSGARYFAVRKEDARPRQNPC
jgi:hypothetical protein